MQEFHKKLIEKNGLYAKWHNHKLHQAIHWFLFILVGVFATGLIVFTNNVVPVQAADLLSGNVLQLDGINDYVEVTANSALRPTAGVTNEAWAYMEDWDSNISGWAGIVDHGEHGTNSGYGIQLNRAGNNSVDFQVGLSNTCSVSSVNVTYPMSSLTNGWHHFVGTFDGSSVKLYIDGTVVDSENVTGTCTISYVYNYVLRIGRSARDDAGQYFPGKIDEVRLYGRAITQGEVTTHYGGGNGEQGVSGDSGLIAGWHLDESSGTSAADYSGNGRNGIVYGSPLWVDRVELPNSINAISVVNRTHNSAIVNWTTLNPSSSVVDYGTTTGYGSTQSSGTLVTSHSVNLTGLSANTTYHYRITSTESGGSPIVSADQTFITLGTPPSNNQFFIAPSGSAGGNGSIESPWDLTTALSHPAEVQPGATIWMRGGTYTVPEGLGYFNSQLTGTAQNPIVVTRYQDEWPVIDGNLTNREVKNVTLLQIYGDYTWFKDFEITNTETTNRHIEVTSSNPPERRANSVDDFGLGTKLINLVIHDTGQGIGAWVGGSNNEYYGNIIYNNGWDAPDRTHGHSFYVQNINGYKHFINNFAFNPFSSLSRTGGTNDSEVRNLRWEGNTFFRGNDNTDGDQAWLGPDIENLEMIDNVVYNAYWRIGYETNSTYYNATVTGNYFTGGVQLFDFVNGATFTNNTVWNRGVLNGKDLVLAGLEDWTPARFTIDNNTYYKSVLDWPYWHFTVTEVPGYFGDYAYDQVTGSQVQTYAYTGKSWKDDLGFDANSTYIDDVPSGSHVTMRVNNYDSTKTYISIVNWDLANTISVDVSPYLDPGDTYELRNVADYFADRITGTYAGGNLSIPMTGRSRAVPIGYDEVNPADWDNYVLPENTCPEFCAFVLVNTSDSPETSDTTAPVISNVNVSNLSSTSATITWTTNEPSNSQVEYGVTTGYGSSTVLDSSLVTNHLVNITGLSANTLYHFRVKSRDATTNLATGGDSTFTTSTPPQDTTPPTRSSGSPSGAQTAGTTSLNLTLTTNESATCKYGTTANTTYTSLPSTFTTTGSTSHSTTVSSLSNGSSYTYYIRCQDSSSNPNTDDYTISFSISTPTTSSSGGGGGGGGGGSANTTPTIIPGCIGTTGFSPINGRSCATNTSTNTTIPGCTGTNLFSPITGQRCSTTTTRVVYNFGPITLRNGSRGEAVKELQRFLNAKLNLGLVIDGKLGPKTISVIRTWQLNHGLVPDGLVGNKTKAMMNLEG